MTRRVLLTTAALAAATTAGVASRRKRMGIVIHSYSKRWMGKYSSVKFPPFRNALDVLDHVRAVGPGGLQIMVSGWTSGFAKEMRAACESYDLYLEGSIQLPKNEADVGRFERELRTGREAGATVFRSAMGGRRYEMFADLASFTEFKDRCRRSMQLAAPVAKRHRVRVGVENHKDFEADELADMLRKLGSEHVGACIDTGNSIALLEDPMMTVETLAPFVVSTHIKDMAVQECEDGFLLSEVPLGQGILDLERMFQIIETANGAVTFNLEMITRDPLVIPCLTERYWATFPTRPGRDLARMLGMVRKRKAARLPSISGRRVDEALAFEEENIVQSLKFAGEKLGLEYCEEHKPLNENDEK